MKYSTHMVLLQHGRQLQRLARNLGGQTPADSDADRPLAVCLTLDLINPQVASQPTRKHRLSIIHHTPIPLPVPCPPGERDSSINAADYAGHP